MPTQLLSIDTTTFVLGAKGTIDLSNCAPSSNPVWTTKPAILQIYNDSGAGLRLSYRETGGSSDLPAGAWKNLSIPASEHFIDYEVVYVLLNPPVNVILPTYYQPNEIPDPIGALGNSPIGGTAAVQTPTQVIQDGLTGNNVVVEATPFGAGGSDLLFRGNGSGVFSGGIISFDNAGNLTISGNTAALQVGTVAIIKLNSVNGIITATSLITLSNIITGGNVLVAGTQETGYCGLVVNNQVNTSTIGVGVNFKTTMTNTPSSITITDISTSNAGAPSITNIRVSGFTLFWTPVAAGQSFREATYTTVGN